MKTRIAISIIVVLHILVCSGYAQNNNGSKVPERIILNLTEEPSSGIGITWRTIAEVASPKVELAPATNWTEFAEASTLIPAITEKVTLDTDSIVYYYSATLSGLNPNTMYAYRVGEESVWSEWCQFTTARVTKEPFQFVFFGDPQDDLKEYVTRVFRQALVKVPDAKFWLFSGDLISEPEDRQMEEFFFAAGHAFKMIPSVMAPGNHDNSFKKENGNFVLNKKGKKERTKTLPSTWRAQFTLPENGISGYEECSYFFEYQGVRFIMLNSNDRLDEQAVWMEKILSEQSRTWNIVSFHHPLYSAGRERDDKETRVAFQPIFDKYNVDLVLTGHDHAYARSYPLKAGERVKDSEHGTVYVVSVSGPKMYAVNSQYNDIMAKTGGNVQLFQSISIDGNTLMYTAYTPTGMIFDSFELKK